MELLHHHKKELSGKNAIVTKRSLILGYGNVYCHDDGVAFYIINRLRKQSGLQELQTDEDGLDELGHPLDTALLHQLVPEIIPIVTQYEKVIFLDAHKGTIPDDVRVVDVKEELGFHAVSHHMSPGMLLATARQTEHFAPAGYLVSVKGEDFDFGLGLSETCKACADVAVQKILELLNSKDEAL